MSHNLWLTKQLIAREIVNISPRERERAYRYTGLSLESSYYLIQVNNLFVIPIKYLLFWYLNMILKMFYIF